MSNNFIPFKPFKFPFAHQAFIAQNAVHWMPSELSMTADKKAFNKCSRSDRELILSIFSFFTQSDIIVAESYNYNTVFDEYKKHTEISMMLSAFANIESIHIEAYSRLIETLNIDESIYSDFLTNTLLKQRYDLAQEVKEKNDLITTMFFNHIYLEGISLFSMFAILLHFNATGQNFQDMGQIISWSMRDENLHVASMTKLLAHAIVEKNEIDNLGIALDNLVSIVNRECEYIESLYLDTTLEQDVIDYILKLTEIRVITLFKEIEICAAQPERGIVITTLREKLISILENFTLYDTHSNTSYQIPSWLISATGLENVNYFETTNTSYSKLKSDTDIDFSKLRDIMEA